jgi:enoyl-CoA hydratase/carnithine racemase
MAEAAAPLVLRDDHDGVATLTLNRPDKLNALLPDSFVELRAHVDAIADDASVRVVVLQGAGRCFCAGNDLAGIAAGAKAPTPTYIPETIDALEALPVPTIARIHGHCYTGGLELALACDLLVASAGARLGDTHGQWGLVPVWGMSVRLPERVGRSMAKELSFTARRIDGPEAARIGLVDRCVDDSMLDATIHALVEELVAASGGTQRRMKRLIDEHLRMDRQQALEHERSLPYGLPEDMGERMGRR